ncbi:DoxX family protein [Pseudonocardia sp. KRD291]|uniref:DoxX family protein n=1 Tax=Pseudonocardia sp. KRD291 TaxID=2792007 RepID=UPI001C4A4EB6|nr:DoxX family protein [Pseudonocardia sp. KRD291]MBW0105696.1 DoxX family protein [Pseudonocardia sp. KRD291]
MTQPTQQYDWGSIGGNEPPERTATARLPVPAHGSYDIGLLILRLVVGGIFAAHGAQKVFGVLGGLGLDETTRVVSGLGFVAHGSTLAWGLGIGQLVLGIFLVVGLMTPITAAGLLATKIVAAAVSWGSVPLFSADGPNSLELNLLLGGGAAALLFAGAGRVALDSGRTWQRRPLPYAWLSLIIGVAVALVVLLLLRR